jgi:pimeloyl-ACP methyl ester carboxylesterase
MASRSRVRAAAVAVGAFAAVAGCTASVISGHGQTSGSPTTHGTSTAPAPPAPTAAPADFHDCSSAFRLSALGLSQEQLSRLSFDCAAVSVPLDYSDPTGQEIRLVLLRIHDSSNTASLGSLLVNPGGPGGSGVELALGLLPKLPATILSHFDIVGFDPRGVGFSSPIDCLSTPEQDAYDAASPDVLTPDGFAAAKKLARDYAAKCNAKYGADLADYDTVQTARDLDQIREAVGDPKLNYLGFSYGTELGAAYLHLFPHNVRVAVLDGAVDPLYGPLEAAAKQLKGFEDAFDQFAIWCHSHAPCSSLADPRQTVYDIVAAARQTPLPTDQSGRPLTPFLALSGVSEALYSKSEWPDLGSSLVSAKGGSGSGLLNLSDRYYQRYQGHYANLMDVFNTVSCNDSPPGPSDATIRATAQKWAHDYPMFGLQFAAGMFTCQQWQPRRAVPPLPTAPDTSHPILVIGNLHDPATPYQGAIDLTKTLGNAELLSWNGQGHTSYLQGSSCVDNYVNAYLVSGTLPPANTTCPP